MAKGTTKAKAKKRAPAKSVRKAAPAKRRTLKAPPARRATARTANGGDRLRDVEQFLYRQAALLDGRRWAEFIDLFDQDGVYWAPASPEQTTGDGVPSIFYEDRDLMRVRMKRITHPHAWSQAPDWGTNHVVGNVMIASENARTGELVVHSRFHMMEFRRDASRHFAGSYVHHLRPTADGFRIKLQRVDMVNGQGPYEYVLQVWV
ncbi:MAG TPA: aromatic-ring-hydroxylating dioxygenase subunit beta [Stellaceae bacterium]|nr:aromatic-ring-hydroxylating dioxygenase subunit beta [Stellaceae bacterium]